MDHFTINRWIGESRVPPRELAEALGIDPEEAKRIWGAHNTSERRRHQRSRVIKANARRFLDWRRRHE